MRSVLTIFWNSREHRVRALWRLSGQLVLLVVLILPLQIGVGLLTVILYVAREGIGSGQLADPQQGALGPQLLQQFLVESPVLLALSSLGSLAAIYASVWLAGRFLDRRPFTEFGLHLSQDWWIDFGFGLFLGGLLMVVVFLVELMAGWITVGGILVTRHPDRSFLGAILWSLLIFVTVGFYEELFSRGYQLQNMAEGMNGRSLGPRGALVAATLLSSAVFGLLHVFNPHASFASTFNIFLVGAILLATGRLLTGELAIPIGVHITWNFFQGNVFGFPVSGGDFRSATFISIEQGGPDLWTGGAFGPEAGLLGLATALLGGLLIAWWVHWRYDRLRLRTDLAQAYQPAVRRDTTA